MEVSSLSPAVLQVQGHGAAAVASPPVDVNALMQMIQMLQQQVETLKASPSTPATATSPAGTPASSVGLPATPLGGLPHAAMAPPQTSCRAIVPANSWESLLEESLQEPAAPPTDDSLVEVALSATPATKSSRADYMRFYRSLTTSTANTPPSVLAKFKEPLPLQTSMLPSHANN